MSAARPFTRSFGSPGTASPLRSPLMSATNTGTPCAESCSVSSCSVLVFPVPVAPAMSPCRFIIATGTLTLGSGWTVLPSSAEPKTIAGSVKP